MTDAAPISFSPSGRAEKPALVTDWHAHWIPPDIAALFAKRTAAPFIATGPDGRYFHISNDEKLPLKEHQLDLDARLAEMDRAGIDRQILSLAVLYGMGLDRLPPLLEPDIVAANNQGLARIVAASGGRFGGLALLPVRNLENAPTILERAVGEQGLLGAILPAEAFASKTIARRYDAIFKTASRLRAHLFVHPGAWRANRPDDGDEADMIRRRAIGFQNVLSEAAITFEYTDFLDPYPDATVHLANLGGTLALLSERMVLTGERMGLSQKIGDGRLRRIIVDSGSFGVLGVEMAVRAFGQNRVLLGSDCPALPLLPATLGVRNAAIDETERRSILTGAPSTDRKGLRQAFIFS